MRLATPILALLLATALPAAGQEAGDADRAAIAARVAEFDATMTAGDMGGLFAFTPPAVRAEIAEMAGVSEAEVQAAMAAQAEAALAGVSLDGFAMDVAAATFATTPDGSRSYALIPTTTEMTIEGAGRMRATSQTLSFEDGGEWWLVRVEDPQQVAILQAAHPEFAGVTFPAGSVESLD